MTALLPAIKSLVATASLLIGAGGAGMASSDVASKVIDGGPPKGVPWVVTVGPADRTLYPGVTAIMPFHVRNEGSDPQVLRGITAHLKTDGHAMFDTNTATYRSGCDVDWFSVRVAESPVSNGGNDVGPGNGVGGTLELAFNGRSTDQAACNDIALAVQVDAS